MSAVASVKLTEDELQIILDALECAIATIHGFDERTAEPLKTKIGNAIGRLRFSSERSK